MPSAYPNSPSVAQALPPPRWQFPLDTPRPVRIWHVASLDAPTVAIFWSIAFAWAVDVRLPPWVPVLLASATWAVYIFDRLLDARNALLHGRMHRLRERHLFHWRHRRILVPVGAVAACAAACILFVLLNRVALQRDSVLAAATFVYLTSIHSARRPAVSRRWALSPLLDLATTRELLTGLLFTAGCALPAFARLQSRQTPQLILLAVYYALLASLNSYAINRWESQTTSTRVFKVVRPACILAAAGLILSAALLRLDPRGATVIAAGAAGAALLALSDRQRSRLTPVALRTGADLALVVPLSLVALWTCL